MEGIVVPNFIPNDKCLIFFLKPIDNVLVVHSYKLENVQNLNALIDYLLAMARANVMKTSLRVYVIHSMVELIVQYFRKVKK